MKSEYATTRSPRFSLCLASLTAAGLLPLGAARVSAQTAATWNGGTGSWSNGSLWSTGASPNSGSADVYIDGGKTTTASVVSVDGSYTVGRLTVDAGDTADFANNDNFFVSAGAFSGSGSIVNNGTIILDGNNHGTSLHFTGAGSITGTGTINLNGFNSRIFADNAGDRLTIGSGQTVAGAGNLGNGTTTFTNNGVVTANQNGVTLQLQPGGGTADFTNAGTGTARAENGGVLELANGGTFAGNSFTALTGSLVQVDSSTTVSSATLASSGTGAVTINSATLTNATLAGNVTANNGANLTANGTLTNNGTFTFAGSGGGTSLHLGGPVTLAGTGTINLNVASSIFANNAGDRLTIGSGQTVAGAGNLGNGTTTFTNNGVVTANQNGVTLQLQPGGGTADFTNNGTLSASNGGTLAFSNASGGTLTNNGIIQVTDGSTLTVPTGALTNLSGTTLTGGDYVVSAASASSPATLSLGGGSIVTNNAAVELSGPGAVFNEIKTLANNASGGRFTVESGAQFTTAGALTNAGTLSAAAGTITVAGTLTNSGQAITYNGGSVAVQGNTTNSGTIRTESGTFMVQGTLNNSGTLQTSFFSTAGSITATGALTQAAAGTLLGSGTVTAPSLALAGSLRPGDIAGDGGTSRAVGTLTLNGQVGLLSNTTLAYDLAGTAASDQIKVNGALTLDGTLNVNAMAGFGAGRYDLIDYTGTLTNNTLDLGTLPSGYNYRIDTSMAGQVDLVVTSAVPEPDTWAAVLAGCGVLLVVQRRRAVEPLQ